ncbi:hypothetical protein [Klebsiella pneumoniae]|nr:hypothetical protein [Klebsiella pneumoniae]
MVENDTSSVEYQLSTSTGPFDIPFYFIENGHIVAELYTQNGDDFNKTTLTVDVDYYLNGAGDKDGGQLTLLSAHSGATLLIYRDPDATQLTSYQATGKFPATSHERALDKLTMLIQKFGWWWDSLALKKPNIFANYYDALNNRIRNLRDPSQAQDAATKNYVDSADNGLQQQIASNFKRSLRVPDSSINQLPSAEERAWKGLGFDGAGQPKLQDPAGTGLWGYVPAIGSFEKGSLLTQRFEVLLWESTDEYWRWDGSMPKIVLPGSTPDTAGGRGKGKWLDVTDATLRSNLGSSEEGLGDTLVTHVQGDIFTGSVREFLNSTIKYVTPELMGYKASNASDDNAAAILKALTVASENNLVCKFQNGIYNSNDVEVNFPVSVDVSPTAFLDFALVVRGSHFDVVNTVKTTLDWSAVPAGTTSIAGDFSAFTAGNAIAVSLNAMDGGSASKGNETGSDFSIISAKDGTSLTMAAATRFAYQNPDVAELRAAVQYSGTLAVDEYFIAGDYTALFQAGDIIRIENISGTYAVEASPYYFELVKIRSISTAGIALKARLNYAHVNPWIVKTGSIAGVKVSGGGRIKRLEIRQCDTPNVSGLSIDRLITGFSYDVDVSDINAVGVSEPSTANFSYCFGRSRAANLRVGGSSSVTDNAALKFMSCPKMQFSGITSDNTTATGTQGDYGVFGDAFFTPYYCWNRGVSVDGITVEKPRSPVNRAVWFFGLLDSFVSNIKGGQVFLQGCVNSVFSEIVIPQEPLETRDLVGCEVRAFCKAFTILGGVDTTYQIRTTGLGSGASLNIAGRFGAGTRNPLTGETYLIGKRNKINIDSLSESTSAVTIYAQSQDRLIIGGDCIDKDTVASSIVFGSNITNPKMQPNLLTGSMASGPVWTGVRIKGGISFDGDYRDGYWKSNGKYLWVTGSNILKLHLTKPDSDSPSGAITIGP